MLASKSLGALSYTDPAWNVSKAQFLGANQNSFYVGVKGAAPIGMFFKPDGLKMYVIDLAVDNVNEYNLSVAWDISTSTYNQSFSVATQETSPQDIFFSGDGLKMYVLGSTGDDVNEYTLSTAWNISTAVFLQLFSVATQTTSPQSLFFKPDGLKMYVVGFSDAAIYEYTLSTAWNISTASFLQSISISAQGAVPDGIFFKPDGTKIYVTGPAIDGVNEYNLSVAWDISTAVFFQFKSLTQEDGATGIFFKNDGTVMYIVGSTSDTIYQYQLSTAWDISTATYSQPTTKYFSVAAQETTPSDLFFKPDGLKMYIIGSTGDDVNEYDLSSPWAVSTATYLQNFSVAAQDLDPQGLFFKPDGTKMYVMGRANDRVFEYTLSTAWNISSATYIQSFDIGVQEVNPNGLFFKPDGTKMYVIGQTSDNVNEYNLSTAWDVSTAVFLQLKSISAQEATSQGLFFKPDGTKMYVVGTTGSDVNEYSLGTAWDISTATFVRLFSFVPQTISPQGIFFRDDGLQMYIISSASDAIWEYDLV